MKIPADQVLRTWTGSPALGAALQRCDWPSLICPLGCKRIRSASRRWWSFQSLWWSQLLTSVPIEYCTPNSLFDMTNDYLFEMNMTFVSKWGFAPAWYSHSALCKLSFALVNDKLQEAEYDKHEPSIAGARTVLLIWYITVTSKWFMTLFSRAEPFL